MIKTFTTVFTCLLTKHSKITFVVFLILFSISSLKAQVYNYTAPVGGVTDFDIGYSYSQSNSCSGDFSVDYNLVVSAGTAEMQFNVDGGGWSTSISSGDNIEIRIIATLAEGETATLNTIAVYKPLEISLSSKTDNTCYGQTNGSITVAAACGKDATYTYVWSGPSGFADPGNSATGSGLISGSYSIEVSNVSGENASIPVDIGPTELTFGVSQPDQCAGDIEISVGGGTPDYTVDVTGQIQQSGDGSSPFTFSGLTDGPYTVTVRDANSCPASGSSPFDVAVDVAAPTVVSFPADVSTDIVTFSSGNNSNVTLLGPTNLHITSTSNDDQTYDYYNYTNANFSFDVAQSGPIPTASDILSVQISFDNGSNFTPIAVYTGAVTGTQTGSLGLKTDPTQNRQVVLRIEVTIATIGLIYDLTNYEVTADELVNTNSFDSGTPDYDDDLSGVKTINHSDTEVNWLCSDDGKEEFNFTRSWSATDNCNKTSAWLEQKIRVGSDPYFTKTEPDATFDFCNSGTISLTSPTYEDGCLIASSDPLTWVAVDQDGNPAGAGTGDISNYAFPQPVANDTTYTITWTIRDEAGFTATDDQNITFRRPIDIQLVPSSENSCENNPTSFQIISSGGNTIFGSEPTISPASDSWTPTVPGDHSSGTYVTSALTSVAGDIVISITDSEGCPSGDFTFYNGTDGYTIHELVQTPSITRD